MGTPAACIYAAIYYAYHDRNTLLPKYKKDLLLCKIFIEERCSIWAPSDDQNAWKNIKENPLFGILEWEVEVGTYAKGTY